jgi:hypothetical protein
MSQPNLCMITRIAWEEVRIAWEQERIAWEDSRIAAWEDSRRG